MFLDVADEISIVILMIVDKRRHKSRNDSFVNLRWGTFAPPMSEVVKYRPLSHFLWKAS